ncbi:MAG TPA: hypothetical protein PKA81_14230 [Clostridia bacterium]|nr:hypothetical protein [Clostridia bacterium]
MKRKTFMIVLFLALLFVVSSTTLAASGNLLYNFTAWEIKHYNYTDRLAKGSDPDWSSGVDLNSTISYRDSSLPKTQKSRVVTNSYAFMSAVTSVVQGGEGNFTINTSTFLNNMRSFKLSIQLTVNPMLAR